MWNDPTNIQNFLEKRARDAQHFIEGHSENKKKSKEPALPDKQPPSRQVDTLANVLTLGMSLVISLLIVVLSGYLFLERPPKSFPVGVTVPVEEGATLSDVADTLHSQHVIRSREAFIAAVKYLYEGESSIIPGEYYFSEPRALSYVAKRISEGDLGLDPVVVTIPEGVTVEEVAEILSWKLDRFDKKDFIQSARDLEGYLFPDTYNFLPNAKPSSIIAVMNKNFKSKIAELAPEIEAFGVPLEDVVTMASIIEKESEDDDNARRTISGVLWRRIEIDMPLQVDAVFPYFMGKNTFELTKEDLRDDSPYNTYVHKGLPPTPIANPGLASLKAAINPARTDYLFYLADMRGTTHFAEDYEEHMYNKSRYLD